MIGPVLIFPLSLISSVQSLSVGYAEETRAMVYFMQYGYVEPQQWRSSLLTESQYNRFVSKAVREFQAFANLNITGELDRETVELMERPRCGVEDIIGDGATARRRKRYVLQGSRWEKSSLTWRVSKYPAKSLLSKLDIDSTATEAFQLWAEASGLEFRSEQHGKVDIDIMFEEHEHGDGDPFDGPGGTLAHAYFPQFGGDIHMDSSERWTMKTVSGTNLLQTLTHEIGHSLGLSHSDVRDSVMAPFYRQYDPGQPSLLTRDDVKAVQALYGPHLPKPTQAPDNDHGGYNQLCWNDNIDAIFRTEDNNTYVFQGDQYWRLTSEAVAPGYPRSLSDWELPGGVEAAFTWQKTGATYVLKGSKYWKFTNTRPAPGYPKSISEGFPGIPSSVDSAFVWSEKIYFTKGDKYWKFDPDRRPHVRSQYPKPLSDWSLPAGLDGALQWQNGLTYFFRSGQYWRFDDAKFSIAKSSPRYPRKTSQWWFGCK